MPVIEIGVLTCQRLANFSTFLAKSPTCFDHQAVRTYVYSVVNFQFIMASQILTRGQLEKMSYENLIASFLALQNNIIQQNDLLQQNRNISKKLLEIKSKIDSLAMKNKELTSHVSVAQNASKRDFLQEAIKTTSSKLVELERQDHRLEQYTRRECLDFSGIPNSVAPKDLANFILSFLQEVGINLDKSRIFACHMLEKTDRTIVKLLNRKDAGNVYSNKKKLKDVDISCLLSGR